MAVIRKHCVLGIPFGRNFLPDSLIRDRALGKGIRNREDIEAPEVVSKGA